MKASVCPILYEYIIRTVSSHTCWHRKWHEKLCCHLLHGFPYTVGLTTLVEAFALGIPVICSRNPNFEMDIDKEEIGITVAYDDVEGWINAIHRIADHPEEAQKWAPTPESWQKNVSIWKSFPVK